MKTNYFDNFTYIKDLDLILNNLFCTVFVKLYVTFFIFFNLKWAEIRIHFESIVVYRKGVRGKDTIPLLIYACDNYNIINNSKWVEILTHFPKIIPIIFPKKS